MMPTNYNVVKCIKVLIVQHVDPNSKSLVKTIIFITKDKIIVLNYFVKYIIFLANV